MVKERTHTCGALRGAHIGQTVIVQGWASAVRDRGGVTFIVLRDRHGTVQVTCDERVSDSERETAKKIRQEYVVQVTGTVAARQESAVKKGMDTGMIEIIPTNVEILSGTRPLPFTISDDTDAGEDTRLKHRYLDLRRPILQKNIIARHKAAQAARRFMDSQDFLEIETPCLTRATPEGARDYLVPSRVHPGQFYALPQSPQIFKQILMVAGMDRYFQICRCFRDEDLRADRQPEFTQIDVEMSFAPRDMVMRIGTGLAAAMWKEVTGVDIGEVSTMTWHESMDRFGVDAPDLRFGMELVDIKPVLGDSAFPPIANAMAAGGILKGFRVAGAVSDSSRKVLDGWTAFVRQYGMGGLLWGKVQDDRSITGPLGKAAGDAAEALLTALSAEAGDVLCVGAGDFDSTSAGLGRLRVHIANARGLIPDNVYTFCWVVDFPLFEKIDGGWTPMHHPFTAPRPEHMEWLGTEKMGDILSDAYDLVCNGSEIGGGSIRIHREDVQHKVFDALGIDEAEQQEKFGFLLDALAHGAPPHGGFAFGFDRCVGIMTNSKSLRDVIAFPKTTSAQDLMSKAPGPVDTHELEELHIASTAPADA